MKKLKKFVLVPDSFKGTLSSERICELLSDKIKSVFPDAEIVSLPVADGGEGTADCFLTAQKGEKVFTRASNPFGEEIDCYYARFNETAVIETDKISYITFEKSNSLITNISLTD